MTRPSRLAWLLLSCFLGCKDAPETPSGEEPLGPPPPVSGAFRWYADITPAFAIASGAAVARDGRIALASSPVQAGTVAGVPFTHYGPGTKSPNYDLLVTVIDKDGKAAWVKTFSTEEIEAATSVTFDEAGDVYLAGVFKDNADGLDFGNGVSVGIGRGEISSFLVKLRGTDGTALWAMGIQSGDRYVQPYCGFSLKGQAVRGGRGAIGCQFEADDGTGSVKIVTKAGVTSVAAAGPNVNAFVLGFDPSNGEPTGTYVFGGVTSVINAIAITDSGGVVLGARLGAGRAVDSAGSEPLVTGSTACFVASLGADLKPAFRRAFGGGAGSECHLENVALAGPDRILIGGNAVGDVDFGDGTPSSGTFGFTAVLGANLSNTGNFERFAGERVFGVATDAWGQSFVGVEKASGAPGFRYTKRDAAGQVVFTSKTSAQDSNAGTPYLDVLSLGVDRSGSPVVFGASAGAFVFEDGLHGGNQMNFFALRFDP